MTHTVLVDHVAYLDADGDMITVPRGENLPDGVPADQVTFWQAVGMVSGGITDTPGGNPPHGNASRDDWATYATLHGAGEQDLAGKTRDELRAEYGPDED